MSDKAFRRYIQCNIPRTRQVAGWLVHGGEGLVLERL